MYGYLRITKNQEKYLKIDKNRKRPDPSGNMKQIISWIKDNKIIDFSWLKKTTFVELKDIDVSQDPVRPELDIKWRTSFQRKIFGLQCDEMIEGVICFAFTNDVPQTVRELDLMSRVAMYEKNADTIIAYTVWSRKKGAGKKIMQEALKFAKGQRFKRLVTLSPLTPMATHYHIRNGAKLLAHNPTTQNFEYNID